MYWTEHFTRPLHFLGTTSKFNHQLSDLGQEEDFVYAAATCRAIVEDSSTAHFSAIGNFD